MLIKNLGDIPLNIKENKVFQKLLKNGFTPWKWTGEEWIKEPVKTVETSNDEVSND